MMRSTAALVLAVVCVVTGVASANAPRRAARAGGPRRLGPELVQISNHDGFNWGDGGIGAASGLGLSMLAFGGGTVVRERRGRRRNG
jgi:hypothetical protein